MGQDPEQIRREIEATRERMGETVEALAYKADVKCTAKDSVNEKVDSVKSKVSGAKDSVLGTVGDTAGSARRHSGREDVKRAARRGKGLAQENPLGLAIGSIAVGFLAGLLVPTTRVEDEKIGPMADTLKDQVKETAQVAVEHGKEAAQAATQAAKDAGQEHAQAAKSDLARPSPAGQERGAAQRADLLMTPGGQGPDAAGARTRLRPHHRPAVLP